MEYFESSRNTRNHLNCVQTNDLYQMELLVIDCNTWHSVMGMIYTASNGDFSVPEFGEYRILIHYRHF